MSSERDQTKLELSASIDATSVMCGVKCRLKILSHSVLPFLPEVYIDFAAKVGDSGLN